MCPKIALFLKLYYISLLCYFLGHKKGNINFNIYIYMIKQYICAYCNYGATTLYRYNRQLKSKKHLTNYNRLI